MKKLTTLILSCSLITLPMISYADYAKTPVEQYSDVDIGTGATESKSTGIGISMVGWGIALAGGIGILVALLHTSSSHSH